MDNIESLLQDLDVHLAEDFHPEVDSFKKESSNEDLKENEAVTAGKQEFNQRTDTIEIPKKPSRYSDFGYEIHRKLKENRRDQSDYKLSKSSWTTKTTQEKTNTLSAPTTLVTGKTDVYAEPIFGLRLINPVVSSQFIQIKMSGKQPVAVKNISYHLKCGDKNCDWVFAGAVVFKSGLKTSQKGSQYCLWKISDLKNDLQQVTVYLFSKACSDLWKVSIGTVVAILNASPFHKDETASKDDLTLTVKNADQVMIWGASRDYGICKAKKKNGENCTSFVNKSQCEFCIYHVKSEYNKYSSKRSDLQVSFNNSGNIGLRNKILGKSEVFYGGKSYTALKIPARSKKLEKHDSALLNKLTHSTLKKSCSLSESDSSRLQSLSSESKPLTSVSNDDDQESVKLNKMHIITQSEGRKNTLTGMSKPIVSRLHLLKEAGERKIQTGLTTRVTLVQPDKKNSHISFATIFSSDDAVPIENHGKIQTNIRGTNTLKRVSVSNNASSGSNTTLTSNKFCDKMSEAKESLKNTVENSATSTMLSPQTSRSTANVKSVKRSRQTEILLEVESPPDKSDNWFSFCANPIKASTKEISNSEPENKIVLSAEKVDDLEKCAHLKQLNKSMIQLTDQENAMCISSSKATKLIIPDKDILKRQSFSDADLKADTTPSDNIPYGKNCKSTNENINSSVSEVTNDKVNTNLLLQLRTSLASTNIRERKKAIAKMNAINLIRKKGGLSKTDPNQVKVGPEKRKSTKRRLEDEEVDTVGKSALSQRFIDLMNAHSKHENLADIAELVEQDNYFNQMEKKEQMEEKMLNTYKVPCKAVTCLKCKYKWFSASDICRAEGHPIKVIDTVKRFFKCDNCNNRTVSLEIIPLLSCKNCGSAKWSRAPMIREKIVKTENNLCIRGDEQKFLDSLGGSVNLNLLVPEN